MRKSLLLAVTAMLAWLGAGAHDIYVNEYSVEWNTPSGNASGAMPIGNGEVGANVWMEDNGNMVFYLSRTDAFAESEALYKLGRVRISLQPALDAATATFSQRLNLEEGKIEVTIADEDERMDLDFLVDSDAPVVYIKGSSSYPVQVMASAEIWRNLTRIVPVKERHFGLRNCTIDSLCTEYADVVADSPRDVIVYHRNEHSIYPFTLRNQELANDELLKRDPLINRTFGYEIGGDGFVKYSPIMVGTEAKVDDFVLKIVAYTAQTPTAEAWIDDVEKIMASAPDYSVAAARTADWWRKYWDESYIEVSTPDDATGHELTRAYVLQKWMMASGARGNYPVKFNGSIFTVDPVYTDAGSNYSPDFRLWGPEYWWQNTRLIYHPMLKTGDYDMLKVLFNHFYRNLPIMKRQAEVFYGAEGAANPETSTMFGTYTNKDYGWDRSQLPTGFVENSYIRTYWSSGLELVGLMLDYYDYSLDSVFAADTLMPMAREILKFYDSYFPRDDKGLLHITPTHCLEMYWDDVENDLPNIVGLQYVLDKLLALPQGLVNDSDRESWSSLRKIVPPVPVGDRDGKRVYVAADKYDWNRPHNQENPELYNIFPFSICNFTTADRQLGIDTYKARRVKHNYGWTQDGQQAARLGLTDEARDILLAKIRNKNPNHRFPAYWGPNFDWTSDQNHGGNIMTTLQDMVMQSYGNTVYLLPAFPKDWNVRFRLHAPGGNVVAGEYEGGKWKTKPAFDKKTNLKLKK